MITRDDVAKLAGVSKTTVSRVLNNNGYVSVENREKIEKAIKELGYSPNLIARSLKTKETRQILFYAPELSNPFYIEVYRGMEDCAEEHGYTIVVSSHYEHGMVLQRQFDGILLSYLSPGKEYEFLELGIPTVVTDYDGYPLSIPSVGIDIREGATNAINYLVECGHRNIGFISKFQMESDQRFNGYVKGLEANRIHFSHKNVLKVESKASGYEEGYTVAAKLLEMTSKVTAFLAFNDVMAIGVMAALTERGIRIPEDISIVGFDNIHQSRFTSPPLTTIHMPKYEQGWESAHMLIKLIKGEKVTPIKLKTELVERKSVLKLE